MPIQEAHIQGDPWLLTLPQARIRWEFLEGAEVPANGLVPINTLNQFPWLKTWGFIATAGGLCFSL